MIAVGWRNFYYAIRRNLSANQLKALCKIRRKNPNYTKVRFCTSSETEVAVATSPLTVTVESAHTHNYEFLSAVPATAENHGSITFKCANCDSTEVKAVEYNAYNTVAQFSAAGESQILLQFDVWTSLFKANSDITTTLFVIEKDDYSTGALTTETTVLTPDDAISFTAQDKPAYRFSLGIAAKMLNDPFKATVYCQAGGVWYSGIVYNSKFTTYAKEILSKSKEDSLKTVFIDLLNYGSSAQAAFAYNTENPANADFTAYQSYATTEDPEATDILKVDYTLESGKFLPASCSVMAESSIQIRYEFMPYQYTPNADGVRIHFEFTDFQGNKKSYDYYNYDKLVAENNTSKIAASEYFTVLNGRYYVDFTKLAAADCDAAIVATIFDGDRPEAPDATVTYSVASYVNAQRKASSKNLESINYMYKYCKAALNHFAK